MRWQTRDRHDDAIRVRPDPSVCYCFMRSARWNNRSSQLESNSKRRKQKKKGVRSKRRCTYRHVHQILWRQSAPLFPCLINLRFYSISSRSVLLMLRLKRSKCKSCGINWPKKNPHDNQQQTINQLLYVRKLTSYETYRTTINGPTTDSLALLAAVSTHGLLEKLRYTLKK